MKKKTFFGESLLRNNRTFLQYFYRLAEIAMSRYEWVNLPDTCDARYLEYSLFVDAAAVFVYDDVIGHLSLSALPSGQLNHYGNPVRIRAYSKYNSYQFESPLSECVLVWNNQMRQNNFLDLQMFSERLYNIDRIIDVNINAQKTPVLVAGSEKQQLTLKNLYKDYDGNQPVIFGDSSLTPETLRALKTDAPYVSDKLYELKVFYWNEALTYLGIPNTNVMKKERVITDEVKRAQAGAFASRNSSLYTREKAVDEFNKMWPGYNVQVRFRDSDIDLSLPDTAGVPDLREDVIVDE